MSGVDDMDRAPLADALEAFLSAPGDHFGLPGHKRAPWLGDPLLERDVALIPGVDDARLSHDVLGRAERLAAQAWGADRCRFSVAGSTMANQALLLALGAPGDEVAITRTLHRSSFAGLVLSGLTPVWLRPDVDPQTGLTAGVSTAEVAAALQRGVRAVVLVEPAYTGVLSDLPAIARLTREAGVPLVVDEAWGAHFGFAPSLPPNALQAGADAMVTSVHKTLTAFTQGALVLWREGPLDTRRVEDAFDALHTTSPSAAIFASIDRARLLAATEGPALLDRALGHARRFRQAIGAIDGVRLVDGSVPARLPAAAAVDPLKLVVSLAGTGADGFAVERDLERAGIRLEMADRDTLVPILTLADDAASVDRLIAALAEAIEAHRGPPRAAAASAAWRIAPQTALSPRDAFFAPSELVGARDAIGRVAAELAAPYPPGIPALAPGEVVTAELLDALRAEAAAGTRIAYATDPLLQEVRVVAR